MAAAHRRGDRHLRARRRGRRGLRAGVHDPRLPLRRASTAGRASSTPQSIEAVVCHSDMEPTGTFDCSDERLNQLHENVRWSMRGNFVDVPTDCPQRDERLGWTGDIQVFAPTAAFLYDCCGFLESWLGDLAAEQGEFGTVPAYVPWVDLLLPVLPAAAWGDAAVVVPWVLYERFGDVEVLRRQYDSMRAWVDQVADARRRRPRLGRGVPVRRLARPGRPATTTRGRPDRRRPRRHRLPRPHGAPRGRAPPACSATTTTGRGTTSSPTRSSPPSTPSSSPRPVGWRATPRPPTPWRSASTCCRPRRNATRAAEPPGRARAPGGLLHRHRLRRHATRLRRPGRCRLRRRRLPPPAPDPLPVVAVPGHDGGDHRVGAVGQHAAGRLDQPQRDDVVQPLRPRRRRRLPAPRRRRAGARRAGLPQAARPPSPGRRAHPCRRHAAHPVRRRQRAVEPTRRPARRRRRRAHRQHGTCRAAGRRTRRRRPRDPPVRLSRTGRRRSIRPGHRDPNFLLAELDESDPDDPTT